MSYVPPRLLPKKDELLGLHSEWANDDSQMRLHTRRVGSSTTIIVDVTELSNGRMAKKDHAKGLAMVEARKVGAASVDAVLLCDYRADRKVMKIDGTIHLVKIRVTSFAFQGVE
jgi:hypothetical protein